MMVTWRWMLWLVALALAFAWPALAARILVVPKEGDAFWVQRATKRAGQLVYTDDRGVESAVALDRLEQIVPAAGRGKSYSDAEIAKVLTAIETLSRKRPKLQKLLKPLRDEWEALNRPTADPGPVIERTLTAYRSGPRDLAAYRTAQSALGMLKHTDRRGTSRERLDRELAALKEDFLTRARDRLEARAEVSHRTVEAFQETDAAATAVIAVKPPAALAARAEAVREKAREQAFDALMQRAGALFAKGATIDGYLRCREVLIRMREQLADDEKRAELVATRLDAIENAMAKRHRGIAFQPDGYPVRAADSRILKALGESLTQCLAVGESSDLRAFLFPAADPRGLTVAGSAALPMRALFNRLPPSGGRFGLGVTLPGDDAATRVTPVALEVREGRSEVALGGALRSIPPETLAAAAREGGAAVVYVYLAHDPGDGRWRPFTLGFPLAVRP